MLLERRGLAPHLIVGTPAEAELAGWIHQAASKKPRITGDVVVIVHPVVEAKRHVKPVGLYVNLIPPVIAGLAGAGALNERGQAHAIVLKEPLVTGYHGLRVQVASTRGKSLSALLL